MKDYIQRLREKFNQEISEVHDTRELEELRIKYLGRKGPIRDLINSLQTCSSEEKPLVGKRINAWKQEVEEKINTALSELSSSELATRLKDEQIDVTLPGTKRFLGRKHPITQMLDEVIDILVGMGFTVQSAPEIETDYYNFEGLNFPLDHPARDMQDTFYLGDNVLLRTHTTSIQQHIMENQTPPIRILCPGKCYRNEAITSRSHVLFYQVDVFYVDKGVTFRDLLATKEEFYTKIFKRKVEIRVRPSYFPFVEPGIEVDIKCTACEGKGCTLCKQTGWLEVCGAGMVHPNVLIAGGIDPEVYSGYAWGGGIERLFMLRHGISDIRLFTENSMHFLSQFPHI